MCFQVEIFNVLVKAFSSAMAECGKMSSLQTEEFWHYSEEQDHNRR